MKWFMVLSGIIILCGTGESFTESEARQYVKFWLHTREKPVGQIIQATQGSFAASTFNALRPVRIYVHGFAGDRASEDSVIIRRAYLQKGDFNVIMTNWGELSGSTLTMWEYPEIASSVHYIGKIIAELSMFMNKTMKVPFGEMYVIGYDLGAHIAGYAGSMVAPYKYSTIFGLSPSGKSFQSSPDENILDKSDASYVEVIQTDNTLTMTRSTGNATFLVNYGSSQPGCITDICSHKRAYQLFAESINSQTPFLGKRCSSYSEVSSGSCTYPQVILAPMGGEPSTPKEGVYYIKTSVLPPYVIINP